MVITTTGPTQTDATALGDVISRVINRYDSNGDGQLSSTEFTQFLTGLLSGTGLSGASSSSLSLTSSATPGMYRNMLRGFDFAKLDNPSLPGAQTSKYRAARVFQDYFPQRENLPAVVARLQAQGINAVQTDHDKIDFGDGFGPIDVIQGSRPGGGDGWQWLPLREA